MSQVPYAFKGDPELANAAAKYDEKTVPGSPQLAIRICRSSMQL
jgi:hypothetical protein